MTYNLLTDSGGFQMVSLAKLSQVTEEGVTFENPFLKGDHHKGSKKKKGNTIEEGSHEIEETNKEGDDQGDDDNNAMMLLRPEDSIRFQNEMTTIESFVFPSRFQDEDFKNSK